MYRGSDSWGGCRGYLHAGPGRRGAAVTARAAQEYFHIISCRIVEPKKTIETASQEFSDW